MKTTIEIKKVTVSRGDTWFRVLINNIFECMCQTFKEAHDVARKCEDNIKNWGAISKEESVYSSTFDNNAQLYKDFFRSVEKLEPEEKINNISKQIEYTNQLNTRTVYKMAKVYQNEIYSFNAFFSRSPVQDICLKLYKINEWTHADKELIELGYGLFVFNTLENALKYRNVYQWSGNTAVFSAEIEEEDIMNSSIYINVWRDINTIEEFKEKLSNFDTRPPEGTIIVKKCKLIKEIFL